MSLSMLRVNAMLSGQTSVARKVYEVVPICTAWSFPQIQTELGRVSSNSPDRRVLQACLGALTDAGLVTSPSEGHYIRAKVRANGEEVKPTTITVKPTASAKAEDPLDTITELVARFRAAAAEVNKVAEELEYAALALAERIEQHGRAAVKLAALRSLLKDG